MPAKQPFFGWLRIGNDSVFNRPSIYYFIPLAALLAFVVYRAVPAAFSDYAGYYFGSKELLHGHFQTAYDAQALSQSIAQKGYDGIFVSYAPFPPFTAVVFAPFLLLPVAISKLVFNIFSATLFLFTLIRVMKFFAVPSWVALVVPVIFLVPIRNNIFFGQSYLLLTALLLEGYMAYKKGKWVLSGLMWSVAILFKLFPVCILFYLVARKHYKPALYCLGGCLVLAGLSLLCTGVDAWRFYVFTLLPRLNNGELNDSFTFMFQSAFMLWKNLLVYDAVQNPAALLPGIPLFVTLNVLYKAVVLSFCVGISVQKKIGDLMAFAVWIVGSLLISPNGSSYSLILLVIPLLAFHLSKWLMVVLFLICTIPVTWFAKWPVLLQYPRLYLLLLAFAMLLWFTKTKLPWKWALAFAGLLLLADAGKFFPDKDDSDYLLKRSTPLIYDVTVQQNKLVYTYWNNTGAHNETIDYAVHTVEELPIQNNQLYYNGRQLTHSADWKKKALLVNGRQIIYLSDKNRGIGFYTLRFIQPDRAGSAGN